MAEPNDLQRSPEALGPIAQPLASLTRACLAEQSAPLATPAADKAWAHVADLARLLEGEGDVRRDRATQSRMRVARFPGMKTLDQCRWDWPTRLHRLQGPHHFRLTFIQDKTNLLFLGGVGLGKTHLATAWGYVACRQGSSLLFVRAMDVSNTLAAAKSAGRLKAERKQYTKPALLLLDELGSLPIDKTGAELLFQVIALRDEQGAIIMTSNRALKEWPASFHHDSPLPSAVLERLRHPADTIISEGKRFRLKDHLESETAPRGVTGSAQTLPVSSSPLGLAPIFKRPMVLHFHATADTHGTIHRLDGQLPGIPRHKRLPERHVPGARLARRERQQHGLIQGLINRRDG